MKLHIWRVWEINVEIQSKCVFEKREFKVLSGFTVWGIGCGWVVWGMMGKGDRWWCRNFPKNFRKFSRKFPVKCSVIRKREIHIVRWQNNILINGLWENNSTIITDSPVEYLRNGNLHVFRRLFTTPFTCNNICFYQNYHWTISLSF